MQTSPKKWRGSLKLSPGVRIERDTDGQPILESLAAGFYLWKQKILEELESAVTHPAAPRANLA